MSDATLEAACSIGDRFVAWQAPSGRPDPRRCPLVTRADQFAAVNSIGAAAMAGALYRLYERTGAAAYKTAADGYAIFALIFPRDPVEPFADFRQSVWLRRSSEPSPVNNCASFQYGNALSAYADFWRHNPEEVGFSARADAVFDWLQRRRTDRGDAYEPGSRLSGPSMLDDLRDDLRMVAGGLIAYFEVTRRPDVLDAALRLADYFLRQSAPRDWGLFPRGVVSFMCRLHAALPPDHPRAALMRERCVSVVRWQLGDDYPNGRVAAFLAYDDVMRAGWLDASMVTELPIENIADEAIAAGGTTERSLGLLAWTIEALLRQTSQGEGRP
jgi:hypothetical protein